LSEIAAIATGLSWRAKFGAVELDGERGHGTTLAGKTEFVLYSRAGVGDIDSN
jgi:hypothetical protein